MQLVNFDSTIAYDQFAQFLLKFHEKNPNKTDNEWEFYREGFKQGRNEVLEIFNELNKGLQTEKIL